MKTCDEFFKVLSDTTRQKLLRLLEKKQMNVTEITRALKTSQPNVSHHLNVLRTAGLVVKERKGQEIYYSLNREWFRKCCGDFLSMFECSMKLFKQSKAGKKETAGGIRK